MIKYLFKFQSFNGCTRTFCFPFVRSCCSSKEFWSSLLSSQSLLAGYYNLKGNFHAKVGEGSSKNYCFPRIFIMALTLENNSKCSRLIFFFGSKKRFLFSVSVLLRLMLIAYGEWQDAHMEVRYTDVDYLVFSDAASLMALGKSPYERSTYRYSPLLAFLLIPNLLLHHCWGKIIFSAADLLVGHFIYCILKLRGVPEKHNLVCIATWLFNPFTFTIGTRGNCEPIVCAIILWILLCLMKGQIVQAAIWYGLIVHFRIYPIIYSLSILLLMDTPKFQLNKWTPEKRAPGPTSVKILQKIKRGLDLEPKFTFLNKQRILFGILSGGTFFWVTGICFYFYGNSFLDEALLYHLTRTDHRHNFSIYFYHIYLSHGYDFTLMERLMAFLPQFTVQLILILFFAKDLPFSMFLQTVAFVAFNKVITAQYFVWYFCLLPLILPWTNLHFQWKGCICIVAWIVAQVHWLGWAYLLEFKGLNVFVQLWLASIVFLIVNTGILVMIITHHNFSPLFQQRIKEDRVAKKRE